MQEENTHGPDSSTRTDVKDFLRVFDGGEEQFVVVGEIRHVVSILHSVRSHLARRSRQIHTVYLTNRSVFRHLVPFLHIFRSEFPRRTGTD